MSDAMILRTTFDEAAELYNSARPLYPETLLDALMEVTQLPAGAELLEIGPGTGQATRPLAERGYNITAVELGSNLTEVARRELRKYSNVRIITGAFENAPLPHRRYDLIYAANAFHWIRPEAKFQKPHQLLKPHGYLAVIHTEHISDEMGDAFFKASQPIYDAYTPRSVDGPVRIPHLDHLVALDIDSQLFQHVYFRAFPVTKNYTAVQYTNLLGTYSPQLAMAPGQREAFLAEISRLIIDRFGGSIDRRFAMTLMIARRA